MNTRRVRWSDNDRYFGPFTVSRGRPGARNYALMLHSGDDKARGCTLRLTVCGHTLLAALPPILPPFRERVYPSSWDAATVARLGRDWYWNVQRREVGVSLCEGYLSVCYGRQDDDSSIDRQRGCFLPWTQWRHVRHSVYGLRGEHIATEPPRARRQGPRVALAAWTAWHERVRCAPSRLFAFLDFDGEPLMARTRIEEREWRFGTGWCRWLSWLRRPRIVRSLDIDFSGETGRRKGSWKGGTRGHSIAMPPGELHESAFRRYCAAHEMAFRGEAVDADTAAPADARSKPGRTPNATLTLTPED